MPNNYVKFQVKSSGQWLNILNGGNANGTDACQGATPTTNNFQWELSDSAVAGWSLIQVRSSGLYLNIKNGGNSNGTVACQGILSDPSTAPDNFLWKIVPDSNHPGWSKIQVKSSNQFLNIYNGGTVNGTVACQGNTPTTDNFLWLQCEAKPPKKVTITMNILDCTSIFALPNGTRLTDAQANDWLSMEDDNRGGKENGNQSSFESVLNPGSEVTWQPKIASGGSNSGFADAITNITYESGSGANVLGPVTPVGNSGKVNATVFWTAIPPSGVDNEAYTIQFTLSKGGTTNTYYFDPKIKVDPSN
ncbi:MAG: RICIN domain-containing protein [Muriicola sp.]|nr:RICIN domain-containing protein [Muriicola sp.]MBT8282420.1 RICIN domain-containing protein [Muriicola sp.]NNK10055.1 RICIN domain-containing protein [Flavobacteriaceae bacterium]